LSICHEFNNAADFSPSREGFEPTKAQPILLALKLKDGDFKGNQQKRDEWRPCGTSTEWNDGKNDCQSMQLASADDLAGTRLGLVHKGNCANNPAHQRSNLSLQKQPPLKKKPLKKPLSAGNRHKQ
jgi:hypothetical protein